MRQTQPDEYHRLLKAASVSLSTPVTVSLTHIFTKSFRRNTIWGRKRWVNVLFNKKLSVIATCSGFVVSADSEQKRDAIVESILKTDRLLLEKHKSSSSTSLTSSSESLEMKSSIDHFLSQLDSLGGLSVHALSKLTQQLSTAIKSSPIPLVALILSFYITSLSTNPAV